MDLGRDINDVLDRSVLKRKDQVKQLLGCLLGKPELPSLALRPAAVKKAGSSTSGTSTKHTRYESTEQEPAAK